MNRTTEWERFTLTKETTNELATASSEVTDQINGTIDPPRTWTEVAAPDQAGSKHIMMITTKESKDRSRRGINDRKKDMVTRSKERNGGRKRQHRYTALGR